MENLVNSLNAFKNTYQGKKVFLTGHTGFKGAWLLKTLSILGADVKGYALEPKTKDDLFIVTNCSTICDSVIGDIRDRDILSKAIASFQPDFIFHLAAQPLVRLSYEIPSETFEINAIGTANLLNCLKLVNKPCYTVVITTDKVYHNYEWVHPYRENDRIGGYDPYSASKACTELVIDSYRNSFYNIDNYEHHNKAIAVGRAGNVIGGGDWAQDRLIPDCIRALSANKIIQVRNPDAIRPWQHVLEPIIGYLLLGVKLKENPIYFSQAFNFGPNLQDTKEVSEIIKLFVKLWGSGDYSLAKQANSLHEAALLKLDISKASSLLNWFPQYSAVTSVEKTINWYKCYLNDEKSINDFTEKQIFDFIGY